MLYRFASQDEFVYRHEQGTLIEMSNEELILKRFNQQNKEFRAWIIAPILATKTAYHMSWLLLVKAPKSGTENKFPSLSDRFYVDVRSSVVEDGMTFTLDHLPASRICNPYDNPELGVEEFVKRCAAFRVDVPRSWKDEDGVNKERDLMGHFQISSAVGDFDKIHLEDDKAQDIRIEFDMNSLTSDAELAALRFLTEEKRLESRCPSPRSLLAFRYLQDFGMAEKRYTNLHSVFPHLRNPLAPVPRLPSLLVNKFKSQPADHIAAYYKLQRVLNGLYFVNGCPGAGKTEWNMILAALIQARRPPHNRRRVSPILFLVDINATVDSAADRYYSLCKQANLRLRIIRMHGWPYEIRNSDKLQGKKGARQDGDETVDFTKKFLVTASLAQQTTLKRHPDKAPTLDEAAWEYYERHKHDCDIFKGLDKQLTRMDADEALSTDEWKSLRSGVNGLYRAVIKQADFIATTPAATYGTFAKLFRPEVIFIDEAPHARELTTLMPIAYFDPFVWIFTGDVEQTQPFVKSGDRRDMEREGLKFNPFARQLKLSTMARASAEGALDSKLLVNQRAYANLQQLPSKLFYGGLMTSGHNETRRYPSSTRYLQQYLARLGGRTVMKENRIVVEIEGSQEELQRSSFWNPSNHQWVLAQVEQMLGDQSFTTTSSTPGTIMIQTPYGTAYRQYQAEVKQWPQELQDRVQVLTVDKAQGNQADVVFLDMVRTNGAGFMTNPQRLNVAITRAKQAEIIVMHHGMTERLYRGQRIPTDYVSQVWNDALEGNRLFRLGGATSMLSQD